ncbi:MAG: hypothetical protein Tsb0018_08720 [Opitutales bacterium]|tara:strand:- start:53 stop:1885 length:1833 start_codon:yes stop_codon:yes gene_type:complete
MVGEIQSAANAAYTPDVQPQEGVEGSWLDKSRTVLAREKNNSELNLEKSKGFHFPSAKGLMQRVATIAVPNTGLNHLTKEKKKLDRQVSDFVKCLIKDSHYEANKGPSEKCLAKSNQLAREKVLPQLEKVSNMGLDEQQALLTSLAKCDLSKISTSRLTDFVIHKLSCRDEWDETTRPLLLALGSMICAELETREADVKKAEVEAQKKEAPDAVAAAKADLRNIKRASFVVKSFEQSSGFCKENRIGDYGRLGSGKLNTVYTAAYRSPSTGEVTTVVYKPVVPPESNLDFDPSGSEPRYNVAVCKLANSFEEYGCRDIIVDTHYASDVGETGIVMEYIDNGKCPVQGKSKKLAEIPIQGSEWEGLANVAPWDDKGRALPDPTYLKEEGIECYPEYCQLYASLVGAEFPQDMYEIRKEGDKLVVYGPEMSEVDYTQGEVRRDAVWLQLIDIMTGQVDRHDNNMFFILDSEGNYERLAAFDNDQCYRRKTCPTEEEINRNPNLLRLPEVMDVEMVAGVMGMNDEKLEALLGDDLTPEEIHNQKLILKEMQDHCMTLLRENRVIGSGDWGSDFAGALLAHKQGNAHSSYIGRIVEGNNAARLQRNQLKAKLNV